MIVVPCQLVVIASPLLGVMVKFSFTILLLKERAFFLPLYVSPFRLPFLPRLVHFLQIKLLVAPLREKERHKEGG